MNGNDNTLEAILKNYPSEQQEKITAAYRIAENAMKDKLRENRHPFIEHPLGVARIVAEDIRLGYESVIAVFLHETIRFYPEVLQSLPKGTFSQEIINIAESLNKIAAIKPKETKLEAENYKRLIVSYSKDPRVTLIKLADRLDVMRNIDLLPKSSQERKVTETMLLYIPIAHQLGLYNIKTELENIFFRYTEPEKYREITNKLKATAAERETLLNAFLLPIKRKISEAGIKVSYKQRTKAAWSIWKKMQKQDIPFEKVMDLLAVRIIIETDADIDTERDLCWSVYSIVTNEYKPDPTRLRDWISRPKSSGYESLHTTVYFREGIYVEVQIRTRRMDDEAENGHASHWAYKGIKEEKGLTPWLQSVRNILESDNKNDYEYVSQFLSEDVFVYTPDGELRRLPKGATVLDFAFNIHTNLGLKCTGATIDGKTVSIKEKLKTGDVVEIKSGKNQKPSPDWLNFVVTSKARNKIRLKLKEEALKKASAGKELLDRRLKNWKMELPDEDLGILCKKYRLKNISDLYAAIEDGTVDIMDIKSFITDKYRQTSAQPTQHDIPDTADREQQKEKDNRKSSSQSGDYLEIDGKLGNIGYRMAKCCNPIYGDEVFGFVSVKEGIKIHRMSCPNAARLIENYPYRIQKVRWKDTAAASSFQTTIKIIADDAAVYPAVMQKVTDFGASLRASSMVPRGGRNSGEFDIRMQVSVASNAVLDKIISSARKTRGVISAARISK